MSLTEAQISAANARVIQKIQSSRVTLVGMGQAGEEIPILKGRTLLHSGPPVAWENMCGAMRNAICGAAVYEAALPRADRVYLTRVAAAVDGDVRFPALDDSAWVETAREAHPADDRHAYPFAICVLERR